MKNNKPKHCVFVVPEFIEVHSNIDSWTRNGNIFDCVSVSDTGHFLDIVAVHQKLPEYVDNLHIWIPLQYVELVVFDGYDKPQIGFQNPEKRADNSPAEGDQS